MNYEASAMAIAIFLVFVAAVLYISFHFVRRAKSAEGYFAAGGTIHWSVNGIAFAGDYLSAASFLGICGMIATKGYDGFLYSIGYLAGWIIALFVVAEPLKKLGKYTFADALDSKFSSKGIQFTAAVSTLLVSVFYLIPQMVGAGTLVTPLLGLPHWAGVVMVGIIVTIIVATAGMASTTYVQFLKGALLIIFSMVIVFMVLAKGITSTPNQGEDVANKFRDPIILQIQEKTDDKIVLENKSLEITETFKAKNKDLLFVKTLEKTADGNKIFLWYFDPTENVLEEVLYTTKSKDGETLYNGAPRKDAMFFPAGRAMTIDGEKDFDTGPLNPFSFIEKIKNSTIKTYNSYTIPKDHTISKISDIIVYYPVIYDGKDIAKPGLNFKVDSGKGATSTDKLNFVSLMLALFLGTAALPHILIRYYTVPTPACARKSTIVAIGAIGLFYVLTLYLGLGSMVNGVIDLTNGNMSAPLLAKSFGLVIFAIISAIAFATVLGTVSGLIVASSGAVAHDLMDRFLGMKLTDDKKVFAGKMAAVVVGLISIVLGILFEGMNVSYLVGWAFAIAASANFPAIIMLLFWKKTTAKGIASSIIVGLTSALGMILLSQKTFEKVYHTTIEAPITLNNPAIISVPLAFITLIVVSLLTQKDNKKLEKEAQAKAA